MPHHTRRLAVFAILFLVSLSAQNFATITGAVSDKSGGAVAGAKITALNLDTQISREATADE